MINFFYGEWTCGLNGDSSFEGQFERFSNQVDYWRLLQSEDKDLLLLGDAHYCWLKCMNQNYPANMRSIFNLATDYFLHESLYQLIDVPTRTELRNDRDEKSCLDHIVTNVPGKCINTKVVAAGSSDHLAIMTTKLSKEINTRPEVVRKRSYKSFNVVNFFREITYTDFGEVLRETDIHLKQLTSLQRFFHLSSITMHP